MSKAQSIDGGAKGYVRTYRKMLENPLFTGKPAEWFKLWILILLRVNWRPSVFHPHAGNDRAPIGRTYRANWDWLALSKPKCKARPLLCCTTTNTLA